MSYKVVGGRSPANFAREIIALSDFIMDAKLTPIPKRGKEHVEPITANFRVKQFIVEAGITAGQFSAAYKQHADLWPVFQRLTKPD